MFIELLKSNLLKEKANKEPNLLQALYYAYNKKKGYSSDI